MTLLTDLSAFAALRGDGLHSKLRELLERSAACPFSSVCVRPDGMLPADPNPGSVAGNIPEAAERVFNKDRDLAMNKITLSEMN